MMIPSEKPVVFLAKGDPAIYRPPLGTAVLADFLDAVRWRLPWLEVDDGAWLMESGDDWLELADFAFPWQPYDGPLPGYRVLRVRSAARDPFSRTATVYAHVSTSCLDVVITNQIYRSAWRPVVESLPMFNYDGSFVLQSGESDWLEVANCRPDFGELPSQRPGYRSLRVRSSHYA